MLESLHERALLARQCTICGEKKCTDQYRIGLSEFFTIKILHKIQMFIKRIQLTQ